jgi:hypothetical protein
MHLFRRWSHHHERQHAHFGHDGRFGPFGPVCDDGFYGPLPVHGPWHRFAGFGGFPWGWGGLGREQFRHGRHRHHGGPGHHQLGTARRAVKALARGPEVARLIESDNFRREEAQELFDGQVEALRATGPALVAAVGDFFDGLDFDQQQMLRFLLRRLRRRAGRDGGRGGHDRRDGHGAANDRGL